MRAILRRTRYGSLLAFPILVRCAASRTPTEIAAWLLCSRSSVYRMVWAYRAGRLGIQLDAAGQRSIAGPSPSLLPWRTRALGAILPKVPRASGWGRTRWSGAPLAATLQATHGMAGSAATVRRGLQERGWGWQHATRVANDDAPPRSARLARMRFQSDPWRAPEGRVCADARASPLLPTVGAAWMLQGRQDESRTPGTNEQPALAGPLHRAPGSLLSCRGPRKNPGVFRDLFTRLDATSPTPPMTRISVVVDTYGLHKAKAGEQGLANHPRFPLLWLPTYCPRANPIERAFGDGHDKCTRPHHRQRLRDLGQDGERPMQENGPWQYKLSQLYDEPEVTAVVERIAAEQPLKTAA